MNMQTICARCGATYAKHAGLYCYVPGQPIDVARKFVFTCLVKKTDDDEIPETVRTPAIKSVECPCGIHRADCTYHKE